MGFPTVCNSTLEDMPITAKQPIVGQMTFHQLSLIIAAIFMLFAVLMSLFLMFSHANYYTKPREQKHIIRIIFMIPIYAISAFLCILFHYNQVYIKVVSRCYEAFAISSFFALMCHYVAPDIHEQKAYFRQITVKPWAIPVKWFAACCCGQRGPWRTPRSGLTWFNIVWIGIYNYCFVRVAMTIATCIAHHFRRYCESSNSPVFGHIWILVIQMLSVMVAMVCLVQFFVQLREPLSQFQPFLKILSIKLVVFLSFIQEVIISLATSKEEEHILENKFLAYADVKFGIPNMVICIEMAVFSVVFMWAFPYNQYKPGAKRVFYPIADRDPDATPRLNAHLSPQGGLLGYKALLDAMNVWDIIKAFGRGINWLFRGVKKRQEDISYYQKTKNDSNDTGYPLESSYEPMGRQKSDNMELYDPPAGQDGRYPGLNPTEAYQNDYDMPMQAHAQLSHSNTADSSDEERLDLIKHAAGPGRS